MLKNYHLLETETITKSVVEEKKRMKSDTYNLIKGD